jgi:hypothetical protein
VYHSIKGLGSKIWKWFEIVEILIDKEAYSQVWEGVQGSCGSFYAKIFMTVEFSKEMHLDIKSCNCCLRWNPQHENLEGFPF